MFDIGFWEIALIGVIALLVVGPERLPALARNVGLWVGRMRRYVAHVRDDIEREISAEEVRKLIETPSHSIGDFDEVISETKSVLKDAENQLNDVQRDAENLEQDVSSEQTGDLNSTDADTQSIDAGPFAAENTQQLNPVSESISQSPPEINSQPSLDLSDNGTESSSETAVESTEESRPIKP